MPFFLEKKSVNRKKKKTSSQAFEFHVPWQIATVYLDQWLFLVPLKGGRWHIIPQLAVYTTYILPSGGLYATYHLLGEPETTIEMVSNCVLAITHL